MPPYWVSVVMEFSVLISVAISFLKVQHVSKDYIPFVISLWFNLFGCIVSEFTMRVWGSNAVSANCYFIIFSLLILWQFKRWRLFDNRPSDFYVLIAVFVVIWIIDNFIVGSLFVFNPYARIINSMVMVLLSIHLLSSQLTIHPEPFWKSAKQLILVTYILLLTVKIATEFFWQFGSQLGDLFMNNVSSIYQYINFAANLLYAYTMLWIPVTTRYSWLSR